ncbi:MAG: sulfite exporter TauE/SafE family protein [Planctomycetota bacterium]
MIEIPLIFVGGLLGSAHCIGMCGPLAVALSASAPSGAGLFGRQLFFSFGRVFTYACCGAAAGFGGAWAASPTQAYAVPQAWLAIAAGTALILMGLVTAGVLPKPALRALGESPCTAAAWLKTFLAAPGWFGPFLAGIFTGFIPCGLVYAFLLKAGSSGGVWQGWLTMVAFGLGTLPVMLLVGYGGSFLSAGRRARIFRVAAWCIVATGLISVARGAYQLEPIAAGSQPACPLCEEAEDSGK